MLGCVTRVKICGVTTVQDAEMCVAAGVDAIGLNFWSGSVRACEERVAVQIAQSVAGRVLLVGVFVDASLDEIQRLRAAVPLGCVQLHGAEPPALLAHLLPHAYKAVRVRGVSAVEDARRFPGDHILLDAFVPGVPGGTGATFDWAVAKQVAAERKVTLAGGLSPDNVADAVREVHPYCVDTASGVESSPGRKDEGLVRAFVSAAKRA
jgi:phosphoribosylanthranilate isomerase